MKTEKDRLINLREREIPYIKKRYSWTNQIDMHENSNKDRNRQIQKVKQGYFSFTFFPKESTRKIRHSFSNLHIFFKCFLCVRH